MKPVFVNGVGRDSGGPALTASIREVLVKSSDNFSWLEKGDTVLLKPALNSPIPILPQRTRLPLKLPQNSWLNMAHAW
jgi:hypothetical protein